MTQDKPDFKPRVGFREIKSSKAKCLMELEAKLLLYVKYTVVSPVIFISIFLDYQRKDPLKTTTMQFSPFEAEVLCQACKEIINTGGSPYRNFTKKGDTSKTLTLAKNTDDSEDSYFLNFKEGEGKYPIVFSLLELRAFVIFLSDLSSLVLGRADESYDKLYKFKIKKEAAAKKMKMRKEKVVQNETT